MRDATTILSQLVHSGNHEVLTAQSCD